MTEQQPDPPTVTTSWGDDHPAPVDDVEHPTVTADGYVDPAEFEDWSHVDGSTVDSTIGAPD